MIAALMIPVLSATPLIVRSSAIAADTAPVGSGDYISKRELAEIIARETGEKPGKLSEFMFSEGLDKNATMADLVEILFQSNLLKKEVNQDKVFLGQPTTRIYK